MKLDIVTQILTNMKFPAIAIWASLGRIEQRNGLVSAASRSRAQFG
jgi:hypothetical protein